MKSYILFTICTLLVINTTNAQDDLLGELEAESEEQVFEQPAFKAMKIGNLQSTKVAAKKDFYLYVSHRFGTLDDGLTTFLDLIMPTLKFNWFMVYWMVYSSVLVENL